ncbi:MAG: hypothetical protein JWQ04_614 [Pedosphaera sp.]|nr:hypothetical protein [Pedosphaera sp.]
MRKFQRATLQRFNAVTAQRRNLPTLQPCTPPPTYGLFPPMKLFYTGPVVNTEMLVMMLEKHGIAATQEFVEPGAVDENDLNRPARVLVPEADYDRAHQLFYAEREDEL